MLLHRLLVLVAIVSGLVLVTSSPAAACSCVAGGARQFVTWSDTIFTGTLRSTDAPDPGEQWSSLDPATYTFDVDAVYEGDVTATALVTSAVSGASCGLEGMQVGVRYVVFTSPPGEGQDARGYTQHAANLCGGTQPAGDVILAEVEAITGPARPPGTDPPTAAVPWIVDLMAAFFGVHVVGLWSRFASA